MKEILCMGCMQKYDGNLEVCPYCGFEKNFIPENEPYLASGMVLKGQYLIEKVMGANDSSVTYSAYDKKWKRKVAIKEYFPPEYCMRIPGERKIHIFSGEKEELFYSGKDRILKETQKLAELKEVSEISHLYDDFEENNTAYIVMEYLIGSTLKEKLLLEKENRIDTEKALPIILDLLHGLEKIHEIGILHGSISPDNIFMLQTGGIRIMDFGEMKYLNSDFRSSLSVIVRPGYSSIEQYQRKGNYGTWTDVYGTAATFYRMITGRVPEDAMERLADDTLQYPSELGVAIAKPLETAIMNALNVKIEDRTKTAKEFEEELLSEMVIRKNPTLDRLDDVRLPMWVRHSFVFVAILIIMVWIVLKA